MAQEPPARPKKGAKAGQISSLMVAIFHTLMILITKGGGERRGRKERRRRQRQGIFTIALLPSLFENKGSGDLGIWGKG